MKVDLKRYQTTPTRLVAGQRSDRPVKHSRVFFPGKNRKDPMGHPEKRCNLFFA
jgi:hypothetical protein